MLSDRRILIAGAGIGGLTAALCLARRGFEAVVLERDRELGAGGAGIQLSPNASRVLHHLGLASALDERASHPAAIAFRHWRSGRVLGSSTLGAAARAAYGYPYYHVHRGDLLRVLLQAALREPGVSLHAGVEARAARPCGAGAALLAADGEAFVGAAVVGADGIRSAVRAALFGEPPPAFTGNVAWRALAPAAGLGEELTRPAVWWGPGKHFVHYPVRRGALINCVCVVPKRGWEVESWTEPGDREELRADFAGWHAAIGTLIDRMASRSLRKWALHDRPPLAKWGRGAVTLLGDACHPMLPFLAQGAAAAIEDAAVLAGSMANSADPIAGLRRYEALRRPRVARMQRLSRRNGRAYHLRGAGAWLRNRVAGRFAARLMDEIYGYDALRAV